MALAPHEVPRLHASACELAARRALEGLRGGRHRSPFHGSAVEFSDHRAYLPGDDLRHLDWRILARRDQYLTRRYREERSLPLALVLDASASMDWGEPGKLDHARILCASLGLLALAQGDEVRLSSGAAEVADVRAVAPMVLGHRLVPSFQAAGAGLDGRAIAQRLIDGRGA